MTRILVPRGSSGGSSNPSRSSSAPGSSSSRGEPQINSTSQVSVALKDDDIGQELQEQADVSELVECSGASDSKIAKSDDGSVQNDELSENEKLGSESNVLSGGMIKGFGGLRISEKFSVENEGSKCDSPRSGGGSPHPPPPPVPPPRLSVGNSGICRPASGTSNAVRIGVSRRGTQSMISNRASPTTSRPSSPRSHGETEGYNSADEQSTCFVSSYYDSERERQFEIDIRRAKGLEVKRMLEDGNCLFRAVADQVYGDPEAYDLTRQMCIDYMERERDHFSQFITEGFTSYCKRKRRDKVYGNNMEIQAFAEMYNRPIHIYSYSTEPINTFHGNYETDTPPIRLSFHRGDHYNSLVDPHRLAIGAGLGFSSLRGRNVDRDQVKAAIKAQQEQQIDNALLAEGQFYSDLELTEKEIERIVMEASRAEYLAKDKFKQQIGLKESSTSGAEPSSSGARPSRSETNTETGQEHGGSVLSSSMQMVLSMGFSYMQAIEAYSIFGEDVDSMVCYLLETSSSSRRKGKATE